MRPAGPALPRKVRRRRKRRQKRLLHPRGRPHPPAGRGQAPPPARALLPKPQVILRVQGGGGRLQRGGGESGGRTGCGYQVRSGNRISQMLLPQQHYNYRPTTDQHCRARMLASSPSQAVRTWWPTWFASAPTRARCATTSGWRKREQTYGERSPGTLMGERATCTT